MHVTLSCSIISLSFSETLFSAQLEGYDNHMTFKDVRELLFAEETESAVIDCFAQLYLLRPRRQNPARFKRFEYLGAGLKGYLQASPKLEYLQHAFRKLHNPISAVELFLSPMHVGTNHWALLVISVKEQEFRVYDSLKGVTRPDIEVYVSIRGLFYRTPKIRLQYTILRITDNEHSRYRSSA